MALEALEASAAMTSPESWAAAGDDAQVLSSRHLSLELEEGLQKLSCGCPMPIQYEESVVCC